MPEHQRHAAETLPFEWSARLAAHGFRFTETGGNCSAYVRSDGEIDEIITVVWEPSAPTNIDDAVILGTGTEHLEDAADLTEGFTLADCLRALEHPSDEYTLLSLRLHNGFHKAAV